MNTFLIDQEITGDVLLELTQQSLKELGISTFGKRYKLHSAIQSLKQVASSREQLINSNSDILPHQVIIKLLSVQLFVYILLNYY